MIWYVVKKSRLARATAVYWFLLAYIITGLGYWFIALEVKNRQITSYRLLQLRQGDPEYSANYQAILTKEKRHTAQYIGEGSTFLFLILLGALFVYREVRRQIRFQQQQQNFMMAVTHELKTPIAVTKLNLETLRKYRLDEDKQQRVIQATIQETNRLDTLANNILIASQLEGGGYTRTKEVMIFRIWLNNPSATFVTATPSGNGLPISNRAVRSPATPSFSTCSSATYWRTPSNIRQKKAPSR